MKAGPLTHALWTRTWPIWARYAAATLVVLVALALRLWIGNALPGYPFILFFPAVIVASLLFNRGSGYYATLLSAVLAAYFLLEPVGSFRIDGGGHQLALGLFVAIGFATSFIIETLQAALVDLTAAHERIAASEHEKDLILREMVHRTKNDLSILHALFYQQAMRSTEPAIREALSVAADRVHVMGRVHERLTRQGREALADTREFITALCEDLSAALVGQRPIALDVEPEGHPLPLERAVPVGLIINELLTNALKYAFPDDRAGRVSVRFFRDGDDFCLAVADDGVGMASTEAKGTGLGQRLVRSLVVQLGGTIDAHSDATGTRVAVRFPADQAHRRTLAS
jgi:two-component sensor histidine kinase